MQRPEAFDAMDGVIFMDGELTPWREAKVHCLNHSFHYGSAVFEGVRIYDGKIFKNDEHSVRLHKSAGIMDFEIPFSAAEVSRICEEACRANDVRDGYIRPIAWRGSKQMQIASKHNSVHLAVACWPWPSYYSEERLVSGITLKVSQYRRPPEECSPVHAKASGPYSICTLAKHRALDDGFDEALMLDYHGNVAEGTGANFFAVFGDELHTPIADCFLNGITRQTIMQMAPSLGYKVVERRVALDDLREAEDCFLTGTAAQVTKVRSVTSADGSKVYDFSSGEHSSKFFAAYKELVHS